jgi:hypothetical protein
MLTHIAPFDLQRINFGFGSIVSVGSEYMYGSPFERRKWLKAKQNPNTSNGRVIPVIPILDMLG